jgi:hypothetical protein
MSGMLEQLETPAAMVGMLWKSRGGHIDLETTHFRAGSLTALAKLRASARF